NPSPQYREALTLYSGASRDAYPALHQDLINEYQQIRGHVARYYENDADPIAFPDTRTIVRDRNEGGEFDEYGSRSTLRQKMEAAELCRMLEQEYPPRGISLDDIRAALAVRETTAHATAEPRPTDTSPAPATAMSGDRAVEWPIEKWKGSPEE